MARRLEKRILFQVADYDRRAKPRRKARWRWAKGSLNRRSVEAIEAVAREYPDWTQLKHLARVANDETLDQEIRLDAAKAAAPYVHPKSKGIELDPDALVELEGRITEARAKAAIKEGLNPMFGLADRIARAGRLERALAEPVVLIGAPPAAPATETPAKAKQPPKPDPTTAAIIKPAAPSGDWERPQAYQPVVAWPAETGFCDADYETLPGTLLSSR